MNTHRVKSYYLFTSHMLIKIINKSPSEALSALPQLMFTVKASNVLAFTVFTSEDVAKKVGS